MTRYLLDANVFIQAKNLHYGFDFVPAFWDWLLKANHEGTVASIEKVADELRAGGDELSQWAEERGDTFFLPADSAVLPALDRVSHWASGQNYDRAAIATFLQLADYWLVAQVAYAASGATAHLELPDSTYPHSPRWRQATSRHIGQHIDCQVSGLLGTEPKPRIRF